MTMMFTPREAWTRLLAFVRRDALDRDFDEELAAHIELATEEHIRQGMAASEARRLALARLGGVEPSKQLHRESRGLPSLDGLVQDVRYAARSLRRSPGFTLTAIATLAIGIGVNTAVFTVMNAVLFKGFPLVRDNDRILYITTNRSAVYYPDFEDWRALAKSFKGMALVRGVFKTLNGEGDAPETYFATEATADTFKVLGVKPILGRDFTPSDAQPGAAPVVMLRYDLWERRFGKDPAIIGRAVRLSGVPTTVIGVMPRGFSFPENQNLWTPLVPTPAALRRDTFYARYTFGRMADGVTIQNARAEMEIIGRRLASAHARTNQDVVPVVENFNERFIGANATLLYKALWGSVSFVLLIVCANVANLLLGRAIGRSREMSVRSALGAGSWRIIRQLLVESVLLSILGGAFGWWMAKWAVRTYVLVTNQTSWVGVVLDYEMDYRIFAYLIVMSIATGLLFGLAPATRVSRLDVNTALKDGGRGAAGGQRGGRLSALLISGEVALAVVLLAGAGVMIRSFLNVYTAEIGVSTADVLTTSLYIPDDKYPSGEAQIAFYQRLKTRVEALPGVESVAIGSVAPTEDTGAPRPYELSGAPLIEEQRRPAVPNVVVSPDYFRTLGATVRFGRGFNDFDRASSLPVAIVNQQFASRHWPGEDPLGKRLRLFEGETRGAWRTVVGVVSDIVQNDPTRQEFGPLVYVPYEQRPQQNMFVFARARVAPGSLATALRHEVNAIDSDLPVPVLMPLAERLHRADAFRRNGAVLFLVFASIALLLASVGLYAVVAHAVSQRTQEIGIRMAMGATARDVIALALGHGALPVGIGLAVGLAGSFAVTPVLRSVLVHVSPTDPIAFTVALLVMMVAALLGCLIPVRRAMRVDPIVALRHE